MSDLEYFVSPRRRNKDFYEEYGGNKKNWCNFCSDLYPIKKAKYIEGYMFEDSDDTDSATDHTPLVKQTPTEDNAASRHLHIITGYISIFETILLVAYVAGGIVGLTISITNESQSSCSNSSGISYVYNNCPDKFLLAMMCIIHSFLWFIVASFDRVVQWQHQIIRRKGYLNFYRKMRNIRRVPFIMLSSGSAFLLIFISLLYLINKDPTQFKAKYIMCVIVGLEMVVSLFSLVYYIVQATLFNIRRPPPDVIRETSSIANSPTATLTTVGFRDGEDLDELLERQADMIRYLQQHNASLGRRVMELQSTNSRITGGN